MNRQCDDVIHHPHRVGIIRDFCECANGGGKRMEQRTKARFESMAQQCDGNPKMVLAELQELSSMLPEKAKTLSDKLNLEYPSPVWKRIVWESARLCGQVRNGRIGVFSIHVSMEKQSATNGMRGDTIHDVQTGQKNHWRAWGIRSAFNAFRMLFRQEQAFSG